MRVLSMVMCVTTRRGRDAVKHHLEALDRGSTSMELRKFQAVPAGRLISGLPVGEEWFLVHYQAVFRGHAVSPVSVRQRAERQLTAWTDGCRLHEYDVKVRALP